MLHKEIPFLRLGLPLCAGIITGLWFSPGPVFYVSSILIIAISFATGIFFNRYLTNSIYGISLSLALWLAGLILYSLEKAAISDLSPGEAVYQGILDDFPEEKEKTWKMTFKLKGMFRSNDFIPVGGSLLIYHGKNDKAPEFLPGDELIIKCSPVRIKSRGNPAEFDYSFYMENQGIRYYAFTGNKNIIRHSSPDHRSLKHRALIIREKILEIFLQRGISQEQLGLVAAMTLGQKNLLDPDQKQYFIKAGVMHIMAVSGLHTVILSMFIFNILFFLKRKMNIVRVIITLLILWAFAFVTGLTPSVLRATLMFSFLQAGKIMKREVNAVNSILASAFVL
ncbi:MAG: ComEC family competence protein, partial [Bacteroidales bacterium]|nr:ComEC family competence protein [Bacteroidales bacterium]